MLELRNLTVHYGPVKAVRGASLALEPGDVCAIQGPFGAGKSSLLKAIIGMVPSRGALHWFGRQVPAPTPHAMAAEGVCIMPEGRAVFQHMTVRQNLELTLGAGLEPGQIDEIGATFPALTKYLDDPGFVLSGGQRQMLSFLRAVLPGPKLLLLDEPAFGLAQGPIAAMTAVLQRLARAGTAIVMAGQAEGLSPTLVRTFTMHRGTLKEDEK